MKLTTLLTTVATLLLATAAQAQSGYYAAAYAAPARGYNQAAYAQQQQAYAQAHAQQQAAYRAQQQAAYAYAQQQAAYRAQQQQAYAYAQQQAAYRAQQQQAAARAQQVATARRAAPSNALRFDGRFAAAPLSAPRQIQYAVAAANSLQNKPYRLGGGHSRLEDNAYDCSSSCSYVLIKAGLLKNVLTSKGFASYGEAGPGRFITIYVNPGSHVFMTVCGLRFDTSGGSRGEGPRWRTQGRSIKGFSMRHPSGF